MDAFEYLTQSSGSARGVVFDGALGIPAAVSGGLADRRGAAGVSVAGRAPRMRRRARES
jgi:hypothetical protein